MNLATEGSLGTRGFGVCGVIGLRVALPRKTVVYEFGPDL